MIWQVRVSGIASDGHIRDRVYECNEIRRYDAIVKSVAAFIEEFDFPGRPYEYLLKKRAGITWRSKCLEDRRRLHRVEY